MSGRLDGRVAVVTGASSGLGEAYAQALAAEGASLVLSARREELLDRLAEKLPRAVAVAGHGADPATGERLAAAATESFGRVDVVVNNAGSLRDKTLLKMTIEEFDEVLDSHVRSAFLATRALAPLMREQGGGSIVNVGSDSGLRGGFGQTNYAAAKGAIAAMTLTWARELSRYGIACNCVLPNARTAMTEGLDELLDAYRYAPSGFPRAMGEPADAAPLVVFLACDRRGLNGVIVGIGGDKVSVWEPAREVGWAFREGGWDVENLEAELEFVLRGDPNGGASVWPDTALRPEQPQIERST